MNEKQIKDKILKEISDILIRGEIITIENDGEGDIIYPFGAQNALYELTNYVYDIANGDDR
jgi:hypothetical protein